MTNLNKPLGILEGPKLSSKDVETQGKVLLDIAAASKFFADKKPLTVSKLSWRPFAQGGLISCADHSEVYLKCHPAYLRSLKRIEQEHRFITHLSKNGVSVPTAIGCEEITYKDQSFCIEILSPLEGEDKYQLQHSWSPFLSTMDAFQAGKFLAEIHLASSGFLEDDGNPAMASTIPLSLDWDGFYKELKKFCASYPFLSPAAERLKTDKVKLEEAIKPHLSQLSIDDLGDLKPLWIHGDWHPSNLSWEGHSPVEAFDFSMSAKQNNLVELAVAIERSFIDWLSTEEEKDIHATLLNSFMEGYSETIPLRSSERQAIIGLLPLCHIKFAISEYGFYLKRNEKKNAESAWNDYLLGHCSYFSSPKGQFSLKKLTEILLS